MASRSSVSAVTYMVTIHFRLSGSWAVAVDVSVDRASSRAVPSSAMAIMVFWPEPAAMGAASAAAVPLLLAPQAVRLRASSSARVKASNRFCFFMVVPSFYQSSRQILGLVANEFLFFSVAYSGGRYKWGLRYGTELGVALPPDFRYNERANGGRWMAKLYFKYGAMGSSKTAQALITKYNYEENDLQVWLIKPSADVRDGQQILRSRIGLEAEVEVIPPTMDVWERFRDTRLGRCDVIIVDECQFLTEQQIDQLRAIVNENNIPVMCFGLRTDFQTRLFPGSRRLVEIADTIQEIKTICDCGAKATVNARIDSQGHIITQGEQVVLGGNDSYIAMCHKCYIRGIREHKVIRLHGQH